MTVFLPLQDAVLGVELSRATITVVGVIALVVLMALSGFFSSSEIAMFSLAKHRMDALGEGDARGDLVRQLREDPHRLLVTILVGNNIANIGMSSIATGLLSMYVPPEQSVLIATFGVTSIVLLFSESAPKSYAVENAESWALTIARPLRFVQTALYPLVVLFDFLTRLLNRLTGVEGSVESAYVTRAELRELIEAGEQQGVIDETEGDILQRTFRFTSTIAREIMVPRTDVTAVSTDASIDEAVEACVDTGTVSLPVHEGDFESIRGTVHVLDLVGARQCGSAGGGQTGDGGGSDRAETLADLVTPTVVVPDTKPIDDLLVEMQAERVRTAFVLDEFGVIGGMVTIEDILEELVGEILRPTEEPPIEVVDQYTAVVRGDVTIETLNEALDVALPTDETYETVAGYVLDRAGRLVDEGEQFDADGVVIEPLTVTDGRIVELRVASRNGE